MVLLAQLKHKPLFLRKEKKMKNNCKNNHGIGIKVNGNRVFGLIIVKGELHVFSNDKDYDFDYNGIATEIADDYWNAIRNGIIRRVSYEELNMEKAKAMVEATAGINEMYEVLLPIDG